MARFSPFHFSPFLSHSRNRRNDFPAGQSERESPWLLSRRDIIAEKRTYTHHIVSLSLSLSFALSPDRSAHTQTSRPASAARARMLPTDQSGLIELRFAVLRPANDRRDISAASGVFARQCGRVSAEEERVPCHSCDSRQATTPVCFFFYFFRKLKASPR